MGASRTARALAWACAALAGPGLALAQQQAATPAGDATRGKLLYESRCIACHSVDAHRVGPLHLGVLGRKAGSAPGYDYSAALARSTLRWTAGNLDAWLADPEKLVPGQKMGYSVPVPADRADLVAYLGTLRK